MRGSRLMDSTDMRILDLLRHSPEITQTRLAQELKVSQPWVATRIRRLKQKGILMMSMGVNLERLGLAIGMVAFSAKSPYQLARKFRCCPNFLRGLILSGERNVCLYFCGENLPSLQGIVDQHIRKEPEVSNVEFRVVTHVMDEFAVCPRLVLNREEEAPCGPSCPECVQYETEGCVGCPATTYYRGQFWNSNGGNREIEATLLQ
jgi:Lrp/AsnC family leucine-responsive transcriptional regulator